MQLVCIFERHARVYLSKLINAKTSQKSGSRRCCQLWGVEMCFQVFTTEVFTLFCKVNKPCFGIFCHKAALRMILGTGRGNAKLIYGCSSTCLIFNMEDEPHTPSTPDQLFSKVRSLVQHRTSKLRRQLKIPRFFVKVSLRRKPIFFPKSKFRSLVGTCHSFKKKTCFIVCFLCCFRFRRKTMVLKFILLWPVQNIATATSLSAKIVNMPFKKPF